MTELDKIFAGPPAFATRGVMLDISRTKVPTMATLFALVDQLAAWRLNHLQLYTEHAFAYTGHDVVWKDASPMTPAEMRALDDYCGARGIELAANQNSLGHLHRWLKHPHYLHLAECPDGYTTPWGEKRGGPFSLNPVDPASLTFMAGLYDQLLPLIRSPLVNAGCDEAFDLGQGKSRTTCEQRGKGRVYLDYLKQIKKLIEARGKVMMFWGDIILHHPELIPELDRNLVALVWGYEADHPFDEQCAKFAAARIPFWVCPGTSCWNSFTGRFTNARANLDAAARAGSTYGATGFLITEWGDNGHWQTRPFTMLALAAGAVTAWKGHAPDDATLAHMVDHASALIGLGNLYLAAGFPWHNTSPAFPLLRFQEPTTVLEKWTSENLRAARQQLAHLTLPPDDEIRLGAAMLDAALQRGLHLKTGERTGDLSQLKFILAEFERLWLLRNRPGGLAESIEPLRMRACPEHVSG